MRRFKGNLLSVGKPLKFETSSSKIQILKLSTQGLSSVIPISVPFAPTDVSANEPGNSQARVTWKAPEKNGGSVVTSYILTCSEGFTQVVSGTLTTTIFTGLTNGTTYTFTVQAINIAGPSIASSPSNSIMPFSVPGAPTSVSATAGNAQANVSWNIPSSNGGSSIIMYRVTSNNNIIRDVSGTLTTIIFTGLTNDITYTFTVQAINATGASIASSPSNSIIPFYVPVVPVAPSMTYTGPITGYQGVFYLNGGIAVPSIVIMTLPFTITFPIGTTRVRITISGPNFMSNFLVSTVDFVPTANQTSANISVNKIGPDIYYYEVYIKLVLNNELGYSSQYYIVLYDDL